VGDEQWQVAGSAAEVYECRLVPAILGRGHHGSWPWWRRLRVSGSWMRLAARVVARLAAERVGADGRVVGFDLNPGMLTVARSLPVVGAPIGWTAGDSPGCGTAGPMAATGAGRRRVPRRRCGGPAQVGGGSGPLRGWAGSGG
jgi:hypothetical protein